MNICCKCCLMALQNSLTNFETIHSAIPYKSPISNFPLLDHNFVNKIAILVSIKIEFLKGVSCFCKNYLNFSQRYLEVEKLTRILSLNYRLVYEPNNN